MAWSPALLAQDVAHSHKKKEDAPMTDERLAILFSRSCVGKSPLAKALAKFYPELRKKLQPLVLYNSRDPRPGEVDGVDYHFRSREQIESPALAEAAFELRQQSKRSSAGDATNGRGESSTASRRSVTHASTSPSRSSRLMPQDGFF
jgi:hypothetical protein